MGKYDDIINLPHHVSDYHKHMPVAKRAAQFAPFAALSGHKEAIEETVRQTEEFKELSESEKIRISDKIMKALKKHSLITLTYYIPDKTKSGGSYTKINGSIKKWDEYDKTLTLHNGSVIPLIFISKIRFIDDCDES